MQVSVQTEKTVKLSEKKIHRRTTQYANVKHMLFSGSTVTRKSVVQLSSTDGSLCHHHQEKSHSLVFIQLARAIMKTMNMKNSVGVDHDCKVSCYTKSVRVAAVSHSAASNCPKKQNNMDLHKTRELYPTNFEDCYAKKGEPAV